MWLVVVSVGIIVLVCIAILAMYTYSSPLMISSQEAKERIAKG
jgi:predicted MFS family arabinose efflux permease